MEEIEKEIENIKKEYKKWYTYKSNLSREVNFTLQNIRRKDMKEKISKLIDKRKKIKKILKNNPLVNAAVEWANALYIK